MGVTMADDRDIVIGIYISIALNIVEPGTTAAFHMNGALVKKGRTGAHQPMATLQKYTRVI